METLVPATDRQLFTHRNLNFKDITRWRQRASPCWLIGTRRVIGEVEVDNQRARSGLEIDIATKVSALSGIDQIAAAAIRRLAGAAITQRHEEPAAITAQRPDIEVTEVGKAHDTDPFERHDAIGTGRNFDSERLDSGIDQNLESPGLVITSNRNDGRDIAGRIVACWIVAMLRTQRRLRMVREQIVAHLTPYRVCLGRSCRSTAGSVNAVNTTAPVEEGQALIVHTGSLTYQLPVWTIGLTDGQCCNSACSESCVAEAMIAAPVMSSAGSSVCHERTSSLNAECVVLKDTYGSIPSTGH